MGLHLVRAWLGEAAVRGVVRADMDEGDDADEAESRFSPDVLLQLADVFRRTSLGIMIDGEMIAHHVVWLSAMRRRMLRTQLLFSGHVYRRARGARPILAFAG